MDLICCKFKKKVEPVESPTMQPKNGYKNFVECVIQEKSFDISEITEYGSFEGSVILKQNEIRPDVKVKIVKKDYMGENESEGAKLRHLNILTLLNMTIYPNKRFLFVLFTN